MIRESDGADVLEMDEHHLIEVGPGASVTIAFELDGNRPAKLGQLISLQDATCFHLTNIRNGPIELLYGDNGAPAAMFTKDAPPLHAVLQIGGILSVTAKNVSVRKATYRCEVRVHRIGTIQASSLSAAPGLGLGPVSTHRSAYPYTNRLFGGNDQVLFALTSELAEPGQEVVARSEPLRRPVMGPFVISTLESNRFEVVHPDRLIGSLDGRTYLRQDPIQAGQHVELRVVNKGTTPEKFVASVFATPTPRSILEMPPPTEPTLETGVRCFWEGCESTKTLPCGRDGYLCRDHMRKTIP